MSKPSWGGGADGDALVVGDRLPALESRAEPGGQVVRWRSPSRGALVVVFLVRDGEAEREYLRSLEAVASELRAWSGRLFIVAPTPAAVREVLASRGPDIAVIPDPSGEIRRRSQVPAGWDAVVVADRWGEVYHVSRTESPEGLPDAGDLVAWLRFLATQCPECGVPDEPGPGEWGIE